MFKNYFKIAWRNLLKNRIYSVLNIAGLAVGMAVALMVALWVVYEFSYDRFFPNADRLYKVYRNVKMDDKIGTVRYQPHPLVDVLRDEIPEIEYATETTTRDERGLIVGEKKISVKGILVGKDFLKMFPFPFYKGNAASAMNDPYSIILTEATAKALFGNSDPMSQLVRVDNLNNLKVTGVLKQLPENSSFAFDYIIPMSYGEIEDPGIEFNRTTWENNRYDIYVMLHKNITSAQIAGKIKNIIKDHSVRMRVINPELMLHPLTDWRLYSEFKGGKSVGGYINYVHMFSIIGLLVLLIACINFMNLSTAGSAKRAKEIGIRKALGSQRKQLIMQFLTESILLAFISFCFAILIIQLVLPSFNSLTDSKIQIPYTNALFWLLIVVYILFTGLLAGSRPAFYLSSFQPAKVLKGTIQTAGSAAWSRKLLVVLQFSCSIALIIGTLIIFQQINYAKNRPTGFNGDRLMTTVITNDLYRNYDALKNELLQTGMIQSIARSSSSLTQIGWYPSITDWPGKTTGAEMVNCAEIAVSSTYYKTVGMRLIKGNYFSGTDTSSIILNEAAVRRMSLKDPLGKIITVKGLEEMKGHVIGVVEDALMESPFTPVVPTIFIDGINGSDAGYMIYRLSPNVNTATAIATITKLFDKYNPAYPYVYEFVDESYDQKFKLEALIGKLAGILTGLAIFVSCLGLFALAAYSAEQRKKEIGVRKVLGASTLQLWSLLCRDFVWLIVISCVVASPFAFYFSKSWLEKYDYRISIGSDVFIISAALALLITLITVSYHAIKTATVNPIKNLRTE